MQRIRNDFTVEVYEMHARICLEFGDMVEFNQCNSQLAVLYEEGFGTKAAQREFTAYSILYNVGKGAHNNVSDLMLGLQPDDYADASIALALKVRAAMALGDYCTLFRLYGEAPTHAQHVMDTFTDRARLDAVKVLLKGYVPTVPLTFVAQNLGFDGDAEAAEFLEDHGCVVPPPEQNSAVAGDLVESLLATSRPRMVDTKASKASFVEHSISAKLEEQRKAAERKAEIVPITFS